MGFNISLQDGPASSQSVPYFHIYLSLLTWSQLISSMLNIGGCNSLPGVEARGTLYTVPVGLCVTLFLLRQNLRLIFSGSSSNFILPPSVLLYPTISLPLIMLSLSLPPSLLLHKLLLYLGYTEQGANTIFARVALPTSDTSPYTNPW